MKASHKLILIITFAFLLFSCKEREIPSGGPCEYKIHTSPATIVSIVQIDSVNSEIKFAVRKENERDTICYSTYFLQYATPEIIKKYDLQIGNVFCFEDHYIVKGTCIPNHYSLTLKKFEPDDKKQK